MAERGAGVRAALQHRDFRCLLAAFAVSRAGDFLYNIALIVFVLESTGSAAWVATAVAMRFVPIAVLSPLAGVLADRYDRRRLMIASDLTRALLMALLAGLVSVDGPPSLVIALVTLSSVCGTPYLPAFFASTPLVVPETDLPAANTFISTVDYLAIVIGPAAGGVLLLVGPTSLPFALNAATFLLSAALVLAVRTRLTVQTRDSATPRGLVGEIADGVRAVTSDTVLAVLAGALFAVTLMYGFELVFLVLVSDRLLGTGTNGVGYLDACVGVGGVLGAVFASRVATTSRPRLAIGVMVVFCGLPMASLSVISVPALAYVVLALEGAASIAIDVLTTTTMQRTVSRDLLARVEGLLGSVSVVAILLGNVLAPLLLKAVGLRLSLVLAGSVPVAVALLGLARASAVDSRAAVTGNVLKPRMRLLSRLPALSALGPVAQQSLAAVMTEERVAPGTEVVREGEPADAVYILAEGQCDVLAASDGAPRQINTMTAPDLFGEIGVVQRRPRTATVVAATDCALYRVDGDAFLQALSRISGPPPIVSDVIAARLARYGGSSA